MDVLNFFMDNFFSILLGLIVIALFWWNRGKESSTANLPPGPSPVPILGNYLQIDSKEPYKSYLEFSKKYGSVFTVWLGSRPVVVLAGYQTLKEALVNKGEEFSGRGVYPILLQSTKGYGLLASSKGRDLRKFSLMTLKNFGMGRKSIDERLQEEARCLVQAFCDHGDTAFNPHSLLSSAVCNGICSIVFGKRFEYDDQHFKFLQKGIDSYFDFLNSSKGQFFNMFPRLSWHLPGPHHEVFEHIEKIRNYMKQEAEERLSHLDISSPQDYIEAFLVRMLEEKHKPDSEFHLDSLVSSIWNLFSAGTETTSSTLRHALLLMMKHPHIQEGVQKEIDEVVGSSRSPSTEDRQNMPYTDAVIHEIQRSMDLAPTAVPHKMTRNTLFKGYFLPKGMMVYPLLSSVLFDPKLWKNPDVFDPENFLDESGSFKKNDAFLPFGLGKRACIGEKLARVELFLFFSSLLQRFTFRGTEPPEEMDISPSSSGFARQPRMYSCYAKLRE